MKGFDPILRDVALHSEVRRLFRPVKPVSRALTVGANVDAAVDSELRLPQGRAVEAPDFSSMPANELPPTPLDEQVNEVARRIEDARDSGYQQGLRDGAAKTQQSLEERAEQLARDLSEERVREAMVSAERSAQTKSDRLQEELTAKRDAYARLLRSASAQIGQRLKEMEDDVLVLAFAMVSKILGEHAATHAGLQQQIDRALQGWHASSAPLIHLNPDDFALIKADPAWEVAFSLSGQGSDSAVPQLVSDPSVSVGGCILRSLDGALDARLDVQIEAMKVALLQTRNARRLLLTNERSEGVA